MAVETKVATIHAGCCGNVSSSNIEATCNKMASSGYKLVVAYEAKVGCCCQGKAAILIFQRA